MKSMIQFIFFATFFFSNLIHSNSKLLKKHNVYDVLVIGAGAAGLSAANELQMQGKKVLILEGRDRVGGRIHTDSNNFGYPIDLGAIHVTYHENSPILELAKKQNITLKEVFNNETTYKFSTELLSENYQKVDDVNLFQEFGKFVGQNFNAVKNYSISKAIKFFYDTTNLSFYQRLKFDVNSLSWNLSLDRKIGEVYKELLIENKTFFNTEKLYFTADGYISIFKELVANLEIKLNTNVKSIQQTKKGVEVIDEKGNFYYSKYIIVTIPLGCLKKNLISFQPALSKGKQEAIDKLEFYNMNKIFVEFQDKFWEDKDMNFEFISKEISPLYYVRSFHKINGKNLFIYFISHDSYEKIKHTPDSKLKVMVLQHLLDFFPGKNIVIKKILKTNWNDDPFSYGSFSEIAGNAEFRARFSEPEGRVIFAGEHTSIDFNAFVYGAYMSGLRAASQISSLMDN